MNSSKVQITGGLARIICALAGECDERGKMPLVGFSPGASEVGIDNGTGGYALSGPESDVSYWLDLADASHVGASGVWHHGLPLHSVEFKRFKRAGSTYHTVWLNFGNVNVAATEYGYDSAWKQTVAEIAYGSDSIENMRRLADSGVLS